MFIERDKNFPGGRHRQHTVREKDRWIEETVTAVILNRTKYDKGKVAGEKQRRFLFYKRPDCREAYRRYFCWVSCIEKKIIP